MKMPQIITKPLVPRALWAFCKHLEKIDVRRHQLFPLFHPKLSIYIKPYLVEDLALRKVVFEQSTDLLLVERPPSAIPRFAFDVYETTESPICKKKKLLFDEIGIHYQAIKRDHFDSVNSALLDRVMADTPDIDALEDVMNDWQWNAMLVLDKIASDKGLFLLQEVALDSVIAVQGEPKRSHDDGYGKQSPRSAIPWQDERFLRMTSFDGLICTRPPNCSPIIAIEYDGAHHLADKQRNKDRKKDRACEAANLPLVRIRSRDLPSPSREHPKRNLDQQRQELRRLEVKGILRILVEELSDRQLGSSWYLEQVHYFLTSTANSIRSKLPDVAEDIFSYSEDMLAQAKRGNENLLLAKTEARDKDRELAQIRASGALWMHDADEQQYDDFFRFEHLNELANMLEHDFESALWTSHHGLTVIEKNISRDHKKTPYHLEIWSSQILESGGFTFRKRFDGAGTDISVVADRFDIAQLLKDKGSIMSLKERATESLVTDKHKLVQAFREGIRLERFKESARSWERGSRKQREESPTLADRLKAKIDGLFTDASRKQTPDFRIPLEHIDKRIAEMEEGWGSDFAEFERRSQLENRDGLAPRDYAPDEIFSRLKSAYQDMKGVIGFLDVDNDLRKGLLSYATMKMNEALEELRLSENCQKRSEL